LKVLRFFNRSEIVSSAHNGGHRVRYWDKGASDAEDAAYTAGVLMHKMTDKTFVIEHVARGRWGPREREQRMRRYAEVDKRRCKNYSIVVEQEPGSSGRESAENTMRNLERVRRAR
jgi:phage terminase large subunit-like protein